MMKGSFDDLGLNPCLLRAIQKRGFDQPTDVQANAIPQALEGRDVVARARTGSGKTLAYLLPIFHRILTQGKGKAGWQAMVLVPTRELAEQVRQEASEIAKHCGEGVSVTSMLIEGSSARAAIAKAGQVVISTPAKIAALIRERMLTPRSLERTLGTLVLDEADLLLSYGYENDVSLLAPAIPRSCQCMLMSATTSEDVEKITKLILKNPISMDLLSSSNGMLENKPLVDATPMDAYGGGAAAEIDHYKIELPSKCGSGGRNAEITEKLLHVLTLLRLKLVASKVLMFVNSPEEAMRLRLFLDAFGIRVAVLSSDQPLNSRHHVLQEFNRGLFDYLIATDTMHGTNDNEQGQEKKSIQKRRNAKGKSKDPEYGVTRGIDFKGVKTVINFDMPDGTDGYVHRVGRTGRAGESGTAVTLVVPSEASFFKSLEGKLKNENPQNAKKFESDAYIKDDTFTITPFERITSAAVEALRYRAEDVARSITKNVIREARAKDLKAEIMNSKKLRSFFEDRPADLALLKHNRSLGANGVAGAAAPHLKHIPGYLRDPSLQGKSVVGDGKRSNLEGYLPHRKKRKTAALDPIKGFVKAPKRGGERM